MNDIYPNDNLPITPYPSLGHMYDARAGSAILPVADQIAAYFWDVFCFSPAHRSFAFADIGQTYPGGETLTTMRLTPVDPIDQHFFSSHPLHAEIIEELDSITIWPDTLHPGRFIYSHNFTPDETLATLRFFQRESVPKGLRTGGEWKDLEGANLDDT